MNKSIKYIAILFCSTLVFFASNSVNADLKQQLESCSKQMDNAKRLQCYDALVNQTKSQKVMDVNSSETQEPMPNLPTKTAMADVEPIADSQANFGKAAPRTSANLEAHLVGDFKGWDAYSKFELDNGQIWRAVRGNARSKKVPKILKNPKITISKGAIGSYNLRVEGVSGKLKVKRVK